MNPSIKKHFDTLTSLLRLEYEHEKEEFRRQSATMQLGRKVKRGICWWPAKAGAAHYNSLNQIVVDITRATDLDIEHNFEFGRVVGFFTADDKGHITWLNNITATVCYAEAARMVVAVGSMADAEALQRTEALGVQLFFDETSYQAMFEALGYVARASDNRTAALRDVLLSGGRPVEFRNIAPVAFPWLNTAQQHAVNRVLACRDVAIVHGPPGTGKTTTLVEAIDETLRREAQVLVCAQSNTAVDWICEQLVDRGINVLRVGNPTRVNDKMLSFTYERRFADHPSYPELWALRKEIRRLRSTSRRGLSADRRDALRNRLHKLRDRAVALEIEINTQLFDSARVVASTLVSANHRVLAGRKFGTLFIDEAAQALEAACWIAIRKADRVVLAGDHCQLPPTIKCYEAMRGGLGETLMERVAGLHPEAVTLLTMQYRMHRQIMEFPSRWFYGQRLTAAPEVADRSLLSLDTPITWVDTAQFADSDEAAAGVEEEFVGDSYGRINRPEAAMLIGGLKEYIARIRPERILQEQLTFGIISPYRAQVQYLRQLIKADADLRPFYGLLSVNTVDGFQGQERDVIMVSLVRANPTGAIGFLADLRRMNVAITRARQKLIIYAHTPTLVRHPFYRRLHSYIASLQPPTQ